MPGTKRELHVRVTSGAQTRMGSVLLDGSALGPGQITIAVAGEDLPSGEPAEVEVSVTGTDVPVELAGTGRRVSCSVVEPSEDGDRVRLVHADAGSAIYERLDALPRIRWASRSRVVDIDQQVDTLRAGVPDDTVLLDDGTAPRAEGGDGSVEILDDAGERIAVATQSTKQGYLVVADSIVRPGWAATIDGHPAPLVRADHALAAVAVPAGEHRVELTYTAPGLRAGTAISAFSILVSAVLTGSPADLASAA